MAAGSALKITVGMVGLGLIGGSMAKSIRKNTQYKILGTDSSIAVMSAAIEECTIDFPLTDANLTDCDILLLSLYPDDIFAYLKEKYHLLSSRCVVVDLCGVKKSICDFAKEIFNEIEGPYFLGGHPMAGSELSGYHASTDILFDGASMILTPETSFPAEKLKSISDFFLSLGFSRLTLSTPWEHDAIIAYTSQLAHVVSNAYVQSPTASEFMGYSAGSFADLTRVAKLNPAMWTQLFLHNKSHLVMEIDTLVRHLTEFRTLIDTGNEQALADKLEQGSQRKEVLNRQAQQRKPVGRLSK